MRWFPLSMVLTLGLLSAACSDDPVEAPVPSTTTAATTTTATSTTTTTTTTTTASPITLAPATTTSAPEPLTADIVGITDTDASHWAPLSVGGPERFQVRVVGADWAVVPDFPVTMNGCDTRQLRVRWRSLGESVASGLTSFQVAGATVEAQPALPPATSGTMIMNRCDQPAFASTDSIVINLVVEVDQYEPAVGDIDG